jgi:chemotaxis family two-component system sensor kinase Cph1
LQEVLVNLQLAIEENSAVITYDPLPTVMADASQLRQLFQNLLGNALKFHSDRPPHVHIGSSQETDHWLLWVQDNGIGLDHKYAERVFVIFQRLHNRNEYPGTGIGLAICKKIVERHNGRIWVESQPGQGTTFYFTLSTQ